MDMSTPSELLVLILAEVRREAALDVLAGEISGPAAREREESRLKLELRLETAAKEREGRGWVEGGRKLAMDKLWDVLRGAAGGRVREGHVSGGLLGGVSRVLLAEASRAGEAKWAATLAPGGEGVARARGVSRMLLAEASRAGDAKWAATLVPGGEGMARAEGAGGGEVDPVPAPGSPSVPAAIAADGGIEDWIRKTRAKREEERVARGEGLGRKGKLKRVARGLAL